MSLIAEYDRQNAGLAIRLEDGWLGMDSVPKNCSSFEALMKDGRIHPDVHWASDLSGEEQPSFRGFFVPCGDGFSQIGTPIAWRPLVKKGASV